MNSFNGSLVAVSATVNSVNYGGNVGIHNNHVRKFVRNAMAKLLRLSSRASRRNRTSLGAPLSQMTQLARQQLALISSTCAGGQRPVNRFVATLLKLEGRLVLSTVIATTATQFQTDVTAAVSGTVIEVAGAMDLNTPTTLTASNVTIEQDPGQATALLALGSSITTHGLLVEGSNDVISNIAVAGAVSVGGTAYTLDGIAVGNSTASISVTFENVTIQDVEVGVAINQTVGTATLVSIDDNFNNDGAGVLSAPNSVVNDTGSVYSHDAIAINTNSSLTVSGGTFTNIYETAIDDAGAAYVYVGNSTFTNDSNSMGAYGSCFNTFGAQATSGNIVINSDTFTNDSGTTAIFVNMTGGGTQLLVQNNVYEHNSSGFIWTSYQGSGNQGDVTFTNNVVNVNNLASTSEPLDYFNGGSLIVLTGNCLYDNVTPSPIIVAQGNIIPATFELVETSVAYNTVGTSTTPDYTPGAVYLAPSAGSTDVLTASTILGNVVYGNGGGVGIYQTSNTVFTQIGYSTIVGNLDLPAAGYGGYGGGIYLNSPTNVGIHLLSSVVATNAASSGYSGMYSTSPSYDTTVYSDGYNWVDFSNGVTGYLSTDLSNGVADGLAAASVDHQSPWTSQPLVLLVEPGSPLIGHGDPYAVTYQVRDGANQIYTVATTGAIDETVGTPGTAAVKSSTLSASQVSGTTSSPAAATNSKSTAATVTPVTVNLSASTNLVNQSMVTYGKSPFASLAS